MSDINACPVSTKYSSFSRCENHPPYNNGGVLSHIDTATCILENACMSHIDVCTTGNSSVVRSGDLDSAHMSHIDDCTRADSSVSLCENTPPLLNNGGVLSHSDTVSCVLDNARMSDIDACTRPDAGVSLCENTSPLNNGEVFSHSDTVARVMYNAQAFWQKYTICKSRADGHCFVYSVASSLRHQHNIELGTIHLLRYIKEESINNMQRYLYLFESKKQFEYEMNRYMYSKVYGTQFGDLLPLIMANALLLPIVVIRPNDDSYTYNVMPYTDRVTNKLVHGPDMLLMYIANEHYDGVALVDKS